MTDVRRRVVVAGSLNMDTVIRVRTLPEPGETLLATGVHREPGGKSSNQATAAARIGADVSLFGVVGADADGDRLVLAAAGRGVDVAGVSRSRLAPTGSAFVMFDDSGENSIIVDAGANAVLAGAHVPDDCFADQPVVVLALESPVEAIADIAARASAAQALVLLNASPAADVPRSLLASASVVVVNDGEVEALSGCRVDESSWEAIAGKLSSVGVDRAIVTRGSRGAVVLEPGRVTVLRAVRVTAVDTTGCGDAFMGAVAAELASGRTLVEAAALGIRSGAWAAQSVGAQSSYGSRADLLSLAAPEPSTV